MDLILPAFLDPQGMISAPSPEQRRANEKCLCTFIQGALDTYRSVVCISKSDQIWLFGFILFCSVWYVFWTYLLWLLPLLFYDNLFQFYWMKTGISFLTYSSTFSTDKRKKKSQILWQMDSYAKDNGSMTSQAEHFRPYFSFLQWHIWPKQYLNQVT